MTTVIEFAPEPDDFVDRMIAGMKLAGAPEVLINMGDKVIRPYLHVLANAKDNKADIDDVMTAVISAAATMMMNLVSQMASNDQLEYAQDVVQTMINELAMQLNESLVQGFTQGQPPSQH